MATSAARKVTLERDGRYQEMSVHKLNVENLRRMFQENPYEVWLRDAIDDSAYFPEPDGTFAFIGSASIEFGFVVEGLSHTTHTSSLPR